MSYKHSLYDFCDFLGIDKKEADNFLKLKNESRSLTIRDIILSVGIKLDLSYAEIVSKTRKQRIVEARFIAMSLTREFTDFSFSEIGKAFGDFNHATVMHANTKCEIYQLDKKFREKYEACRNYLVLWSGKN